MEILKIATDWAKAEIFSTSFFIFFGLLFVAASIGFWQLGKTDIAKAYVIPMLVAGILVLVIGFGLFFNNKYRVTKFEKDYHKDAPAFVQSEIERVDATLKEYKTSIQSYSYFNYCSSFSNHSSEYTTVESYWYYRHCDVSDFVAGRWYRLG